MMCENDEALVIFRDALQFGEELLDGDGRSGLFGQDIVEAVDDDESDTSILQEILDFLDDLVVFEDDVEIIEFAIFYTEFPALFSHDRSESQLFVFSGDVKCFFMVEVVVV